MLLLWILVLIVGVAYLAHRRIAPLPALGIVAAYLVAMGIFSHAPGWLLFVFWVLLAVVAAPLLLPDLRRKHFTAPLFNWFQRTLPPMSQTERDAIDAGTVWWDGELFSGRPDWDKLLSYPKVQLSEEEQSFIDGRPKNSARWSATGRSASPWTCRPRPGRTSRNTAFSP